jgi:hypothetical protein
MTSASPEIVSTPTPSLLVQEGDAASPEVGGRFSRIACASLNDEGEVAFSADLSGAAVPGALFLRSRSSKNKNAMRALLRAGDPAPGGGRYTGFSDLDLASFRTDRRREVMLSFRAELEGGPSPEGLFLWTRDGVRVIALAGTEAARGGIFRSFARPTLIVVQARSGAGYILAYEATFQSGARSVVVHPSYAEPLDTLTTGDLLGEQEVLDFSMSRMAGCLSCVVQLRGKDGETAREVTFVKHGMTVHGGSLREGAQFPALGTVRTIAGPPAVSLQTAFAAVAFADGANALVTADVLGGAQVFARSGDVSPGLADDPIDSFGPPISNAAFPLSCPPGLVAPVRLRSGRSALWSAVFSGVMPLQGEQRLLSLEGGDAVPVKLTNHGTLLLRQGGLWRVIEGLFGPVD